MKRRLRCIAAVLALAFALFPAACGDQEIEERRFVFVGSGGAISVDDREPGASWVEIRADGSYYGNIDFARPELKLTLEGKYDPENGFDDPNITETSSGLSVRIETSGMIIDARFVLEK